MFTSDVMASAASARAFDELLINIIISFKNTQVLQGKLNEAQCLEKSSGRA